MLGHKALFVGINYPNTKNELRGCNNDIKNMRKVLIDSGMFAKENITMVSDDKKISNIMPTRKNILETLVKVVRSAKDGEIVYIHYSGHGTFTRDLNNDEPDGRDEAICPSDDTVITDDEFNDMISRVKRNVRIIAVSDSCHSGTIADFENKKPQTHGYVLTISGCLDKQTSADALEENQYQGALTAGLRELIVKSRGLKNVFDVLLSNSETRIKKFQDSLRGILKEKGYEQIPVVNRGGMLPLLTFRSANSERTLRQTAARSARGGYQPVIVAQSHVPAADEEAQASTRARTEYKRLRPF